MASSLGVIVDRRGARTVVGIGVATLAVALLLAAIYPQGITTIIVALILLGVGWSFTNVAGSAHFNEALTTPAKASASRFSPAHFWP